MSAENVLHLEAWADGSGTVATLPAGIGVVLCCDGVPVCEASEGIGPGTNNVAEVTAVGRALGLARAYAAGAPFALVVRSDSRYALAVDPASTWYLKKEPVASLARRVRAFARTLDLVRFEHVKGHAGAALNERADWLAGRGRLSGAAAAARATP